ncbi:MAG TPA: hypothetical protein VFZ61_33825 [Polyangiales bacterium]
MALERLQLTHSLGAQRDPFLHALLGVAALCQQFDRLVQPGLADEAGDRVDDATEDVALLAALGALSLRRTLSRYQAALEERPANTGAPGSGPSVLPASHVHGRLLR